MPHGELPVIIKGEGLCLHSSSKLSELMKGIQCSITVSYTNIFDCGVFMSADGNASTGIEWSGLALLSMKF